MHERDLANDFRMILEQYKQSPFGFRLRRTGALLRLVEHNGLLYIDNSNLFKIVCELLGPEIPDEMSEYIAKMTFSEVISLDASSGGTSRMTCVQFVDYMFFEKCREWLSINEIYHREAGNGYMFSMLSPEKDYASQQLFSGGHEGKHDEIEEMFPFSNIWKYRNLDFPYDTGEVAAIGCPRGMTAARPRGKQMFLSKESLKERPYVCDAPHCDRAFKRYEHLKRHAKMHTGDRPFVCTFAGCTKAFSRSDNLTQHMKTHGMGAKPRERIFFRNVNTSEKTL